MNIYEKLLDFGLLSIPIILLSWRSLKSPKNHGFYRFFGWECILWLLINSYRFWFIEPLGIRQLVSWLLLFYSAYLILAGLIFIVKLGKPSRNRADSTLFNMEKTSELVETGVYKYIRHPIYGSLIFLTWGIFLKNITLELLLISCIATVFFYLTSKFEERENLNYFGENYKDYMQRSKMFIPFVF
ncbi:MAG: isoprenylcysteine carboxylmethyltransferase family protein [FCB group bacterium]|jgi:protein-S-isoprenylcysteine O-methyltransferase Ste14